MKQEKQRGFTLLEVTVVLGVITLVIAGIISSRALIRNSQLQAVMSEYQMYAIAIKNFKSKYYALPGDFGGATALWGTGTCPIGASTGTQTCDGNANGFVAIDGNYEHIIAWRQLGISGFINQNYTGNTASGSPSCDFDIKEGENAPASKLKGAGWNIGSSTYSATTYSRGTPGVNFPMSASIDPINTHALWFGGNLQYDSVATTCTRSQIPVLTGSEAYQMDMKYDDQTATSGKMRSQYNNTLDSPAYQTCENAASTFGGYRTDATGVNCALVFILEP